MIVLGIRSGFILTVADENRPQRKRGILVITCTSIFLFCLSRLYCLGRDPRKDPSDVSRGTMHGSLPFEEEPLYLTVRPHFLSRAE